MSTVKQEVQNLLSDLPDTSTLEEIQYHLYAIAKIRNGIAAAEQLGVMSQDDVEGEILQWLSSK